MSLTKGANTMNIEISGNIGQEEANAYIDYLQSKYNRKLEKLDVKVDGEYVELDYKFAPVKIERIRRITGYLVGAMDNWNDAKTAEERDRVKHEVVSENGQMEAL